MRECGDCCLCCNVIGLDSGKPAFAWCQYCRPEKLKACGIYENRPEECRKFNCLWRLEAISEFAFPKTVGFVVIAGENNRVRIIEKNPGASIRYPSMYQAIMASGFIPEIIDRLNYKISK